MLPLFFLACDVCGNYMGITPYDNKNSLSLLHRYRVFNGYRNYQKRSSFFPTGAYKIAHGDPLEAKDSVVVFNNYASQDFESYKVVELRFKYFATKKIELNLFIPVIDNKSKTNGYSAHLTGFGDASVNVGYHLIKPKSEAKIKHKLIVGVGLKLPTGNFYAHDNNSNRLPFEMQPGTGSWDGFGYINYVGMTNNFGLSVSLNYKANGQNKFSEQMMGAQNHLGSVFYKFKLKKTVLYPSIQFNGEYTKGLSVKKTMQQNTGVNSLLIGPGLDVYYKKIAINTCWQFTAAEKIKDGALKSVGRISVGLSYLFGS